MKLRPAKFNPATGDESSLWLWFALLVSGSAVAMLIAYDNRRRMKKN